MSRLVEFRRTVNDLFKDRSYWLLHAIGKHRPGAPPTFNRPKLQRAIEKLQNIASEALASELAKTEFEKSVAKKKSWHVRGHGWQAKKRLFKAWFDKHVPYRSVVYVFWRDRQCVYVGKTRLGRGRPSDHFVKHWFRGVTRIDIYAVRGKRSLACMECLTVHRFRPAENENKPQSARWTRKCPLCNVHRDSKSETESVFWRK
jgi:hypothetical protein